MTEELSTEEVVDTTVSDDNAAPSPADEPKEAEPGKTDAPADAADHEETDKPDPDEPEKAEKERRNKVSAQERINELTRQKYEERRRADELEQRLKELDEKITQNQPEIKKPRYADFDSDEDFEAAVSDYHRRVATREQEENRRKETQEQEAQRKQAESIQATQKFVSDMEREKAHYHDLDKVMADPTFAMVTNQMSPEILSLIQTSDKNVALAYHLGTNIDVAEKIASLPPIQAARELALLESRLEVPKPKTVTNAPEPTKTGASNTTTEKDPSKMSSSEFAAWRRRQIANRG